MAKPLLTVVWHDKVIGTRRSDRAYTHAVVLVNFNEDTARAAAAASWRAFGRRNAVEDHAHCIEAQSPSYRHASVVSDEQRAAYAASAALSVEVYVEQQRDAGLVRLNDRIARCIAAGPVVLSYHGSEALARKAQFAANDLHTEYTAFIAAVSR